MNEEEKIAIFRAGFLAGFAASGEGFNGEFFPIVSQHPPYDYEFEGEPHFEKYYGNALTKWMEDNG